MPNSRRIGKVAEQQAAHTLNELLGTSFRRSQQYKGTAESADIIDDAIPNLYVEVKRRVSMNLHDVVEQAQEESADHAVAVVMHKKPRRGWLVTVAVEDLPGLCNAVHGVLQRGETEV